MKRNLVYALKKGQLNDAEHLLTQLQQFDPISKGTRCFELELALRQRDLSRSQRLAAELVVHFPDSSRVLFLAGQARFLHKDYATALPLFRESFRLSQKPQVQWWLGRTLLRFGDLTNARPALENVKETVFGALLDIAWLEELEGNLNGAAKSYERFLKLFPENAFAKSGLARVKALGMDPTSLREEIESLEQWGETPPKHLVPVFLKRLLETGEIAKARKYISGHKTDPTQTNEIAWIFYKAHAFDIAFDLFRQDLASNLTRFTVLNAFETAAEKCSRIPEAIDCYERLAAHHKNLYGRIVRLKKRLERKARASRSLLKCPPVIDKTN